MHFVIILVLLLRFSVQIISNFYKIYVQSVSVACNVDVVFRFLILSCLELVDIEDDREVSAGPSTTEYY